jgi:flagellar basal body-associated protein FliL
MSEIKDLVISEMQTLNSEQLRDQKERELLRQRLLRRVESLLPNAPDDWEDPNPIKKVLITEFYLQ